MKHDLCHFERTPLSGETAVFRVRVKGDPKPDVSWKKTKGSISENETFQTTYDESTGEHVLKVGEFTVKAESGTTLAFWASSNLPLHVCRFTKSRQQKWTLTSVSR